MNYILKKSRDKAVHSSKKQKGGVGTIVLSSLFLMLFSSNVQAQNFDSVLKSIDQHSRTLRAARLESDAEKADTRLLNTLEDPELGFNYLFGNGDLGIRKDVSVAQSFDMPNVWRSRSKLAKEQRRTADLRYLDERQKLLVKAHKLCIEVVYYNAMINHLEEDIEESRGVSEVYQKLFDKGESTIIDLNKTHQAVLFFEAEHRAAITNRDNMLAELQYMNGGEPVEINDTAFVIDPIPTDFDEWLKSSVDRHPTIQLAESELAESKQNLSVSKNEWTPKLKLGYMAEMEKEDQFHGLTFGISFPLWSGTKKVRAAKAHMAAAQERYEDTRMELTTQLRAIHAEAVQLQQTCNSYSRHINHCDNEAFLRKSLDAGKITLLEYLQDCQYVHEVFERLFDAERDLKLRLAELRIDY